MKMFVFVYGTLKKNYGNNYFLRGCPFVKNTKTSKKYKMVDLGPFPALFEMGEDEVEGELWEVDQKTLKRLDQLEGHPDLYERKEIELEDGNIVYGYIFKDESYKLKEGITNWKKGKSCLM